MAKALNIHATLKILWTTFYFYFLPHQQCLLDLATTLQTYGWNVWHELEWELASIQNNTPVLMFLLQIVHRYDIILIQEVRDSDLSATKKLMEHVNK